MIRNIKIDNLRGLAIFLVVLGHFYEKTAIVPQTLPSIIFIGIVFIRMPLFVFISGYLSKIGPDNTVKAFNNILIPYFLFTIMWIFTDLILDGKLSLSSFIIPAPGLWYLMSLFLWRSFLPAIDKLKYPIFFSIIIALLASTWNGLNDYFSLSRAVLYLPIFLFGFYFKHIREILYFQKFKEKVNLENKYISLAILIILLAVSVLFFASQKAAILAFTWPFNEVGVGNLKGMILLIIAYISRMSIILILFFLMTRKRTLFTKIGKNSLSIYVFHFYFLFYLPPLLQYLGLGFIFENIYLGLTYVFLTTIMVIYILSRDIINKGVNYAINEFRNFIMKKEDLIQ
ncbi:MAG: acyltransferase family protein [Methanobacteriaceae archaeon]|nr:acyltransferase family protein [Methanobacteriaceae archaeon]